MADITKCTGENCSFKTNCYRFTAIASARQSFFMNPPCELPFKCTHYWENIPHNTFINQLQSE